MSTVTAKQNKSISLYKVLACFGVIVVHLIVHNADYIKDGYNDVVYLVYSLCVDSIDAFAIISGFFSVKEDNRLRKAISLESAVLFYSISISAIGFFVFKISFTTQMWLSTFFPAVNDRYWYYTAYLILLLIVPILNKIIGSLSNKHLKLVILTMLFGTIACGLIGINWNHTSGLLNRFMLVFFYFVGAYIRRLYDSGSIHKKYNVIYIMSSMFLLLLPWFLAKNIGSFNSPVMEYFWQPSSVTSILGTICCFVFFLNIDDAAISEYVNTFASSAFYVWIIHDHPILRNLLITNHGVAYNMFAPIFTTPIILCRAVVVFFGCFIIEQLRKRIVKRSLGWKPIIGMRETYIRLVEKIKR